jgi:hypothetical protein
MPPKDKVGPQRRAHYDEVVDDWVKFLKKGHSHLRANVRLCISKEVTPEIYTSALTRECARVDVYQFSADSTRAGHILQAPRGSSLYALVEAKYRSAFDGAIPLFRVWPVQWLLAYLKRLGPLALGLLLLLIAGWLSWKRHYEFVVTVLGGTAVNFITQFRLSTRPLKEIYK